MPKADRLAAIGFRMGSLPHDSALKILQRYLDLAGGFASDPGSKPLTDEDLDLLERELDELEAVSNEEAKLKAHDLAQSQCPRCGYKFDRSGSLCGAERAPNPGDIAVCAGCGALLQFAADLSLELAAPSVMFELAPETRAVIRQTQAFVKSRSKLN